MYLKIVTGISAVVIASGSALAQAHEAPSPEISPDRLEDVPANILRPDFFGSSGKSVGEFRH